MKNLLKMSDLSPAELTHILDVADQLKAQQKLGGTAPLLAGKTVALMFSKASTRTRTSFEVGVYQLGGLGNYMNTAELQAGRGEPLKDTARVLGRYYDCVVWRTYRQSDLEEFAELAGVPVINGLTDYAHPCQVLADLMTIREFKSSFDGLKMCFIGDGNNMAHSLMYACAKVGMNMVCASPKGYQPDPEIVRTAQEDAALTGCTIEVDEDLFRAAKGADVLYTDVWASMGQEAEQSIRQEALGDYQINKELLSVARPDAMVLHCLPAHRGEEITEEVLEGPQSKVFDQAENRLHVQKAIMALLMTDDII